MITDANFLECAKYVEEWELSQEKNRAKLDFCIAVYNFNHTDKLVRQSCGCDYSDKFIVIGIWVRKSIKLNEVIKE